MNKLLNSLSWSAYLETIALLAIAYYAFIGWKYYRPEINKLIVWLKGESYDTQKSSSVLQYQDEEIAEPAATHKNQRSTRHRSESLEYEEPNGAFYELRQALTTCINEASGKPFAPAILIPKFKKILNDYPDIAASHERDEINALIVRECEKTGTALLSESEIDMWWSA